MSSIQLNTGTDVQTSTGKLPQSHASVGLATTPLLGVRCVYSRGRCGLNTTFLFLLRGSMAEEAYVIINVTVTFTLRTRRYIRRKESAQDAAANFSFSTKKAKVPK